MAHREGPLLVLAGPGTGKTTTLVEAMAARLSGGGDPGDRQGIPPSRMLALTFGRRAAASMRARLARRLGDGELPIVATFHSFAFGVARRAAATQPEVAPVRLLTAPEQERRLRELFRNSVRAGRVDWPASLRAALGTRGLAAELRSFLSRARILGLTGADVARSADEFAVPLWRSLAPFVDEYLDVLDAEGVLDYVEVINRATLALVEAHEPQFDAVFVDEYQDTDPSQVRLLEAMIRPSTAFVAVGDPDQAIYGFRGADVTGVREFRDRFRGPDGVEAEVVVLRRNRRFGTSIRNAAREVIKPVSLAGLPARTQRDHRELQVEESLGEGTVTVREFESPAEHAAGVARLIRRERMRRQDGSWSDIAVLVRSGVRDLPPLVGALAAARIPTAVPRDEILLRQDPAVAPLLLALRFAADGRELSPGDAMALAESPLGGVDPFQLRTVARQLRRRERPDLSTEGRSGSRGGTFLIARELVADLPFDGLDAAACRELRTLGTLLKEARQSAVLGAPVEDVLWQVWSATSWPERLHAEAHLGGPLGRAADRSLDAVLALFDLAGRLSGRDATGVGGLRNFLEEIDLQSIPGGAESVRLPVGDRVALMTAHRAKGLEWPVVVVAGVQEDSWPDLRLRHSLLEVERLCEPGRGATLPTTSDLVADERRLFYVACTRAREHLLVTTVCSTTDSGPRPSRFVEEVRSHQTDDRASPGESATIGSVVELVADLRLAMESPESSTDLRAHARAMLARLASNGVGGSAGPVAGAHPTSWWGRRAWTVGVRPIVDPEVPARLSGSSWTGLEGCPLKWLLERRVRAGSATGGAAAFGSLVHALAEGVAKAELESDAAVLEQVARDFWPELDYEANWQAQAEFKEARYAIERLVAWFDGRPDRRPVASELHFEIEIESGAGRVALNGMVDRLEVSSEGLHVIDFKTQREPVSKSELGGHRQLQLYQLAAQQGAFDDELADLDAPRAVAGAELVLLRRGSAGSPLPMVQTQGPIEREKVLADLTAAVEMLRAERFAPNPKGGQCWYCDFHSVCPAGMGVEEAIE